RLPRYRAGRRQMLSADTQKPRRGSAGASFSGGGDSLCGAAELVAGSDQLAAEAANRQTPGLGEVVNLAGVASEKIGDLGSTGEQVVSEPISLLRRLFVHRFHDTAPRKWCRIMLLASARFS